MKFSVGVEYSLHCLLYLINDNNRAIGIKDLSNYQGVSESYLSKFFTKLKKYGIVESIPGVKGGYKLAKSPKEITFWDVIEAIEGSEYMFRCDEIRANEIILDKNNLPDSHVKIPCLIHQIMLNAEDEMRNYLKNRTLDELSKQVIKKIPAEHLESTTKWFNRNF